MKEVHVHTSVYGSGTSILVRTFLPLHYPLSVREEYLEYQFWDSLQGLSSYIRGILTSQYILVSLGVGDSQATALNASLLWACKDGIGIIASLVFAYTSSDYFEAYPCEFRLLADILCNIGLFLNMMISLYPDCNVVLTISSSICFACLGIAAGATKSKISSHLARPGYLSDVTAKESTQETAITLIGMTLGTIITHLIGGNTSIVWIIFIISTIIHQYANFKLVSVLKFYTLNPPRMLLVADAIYKREKEKEKDGVELPSVLQVYTQERSFTYFVLPIFITWYGPQLGASLEAHLVNF